MALLHMFSTGVVLALNRGMILMLAIIGVYGITGVIWKQTPIKGVATILKTCYDYSVSKEH